MMSQVQPDLRKGAAAPAHRRHQMLPHDTIAQNATRTWPIVLRLLLALALSGCAGETGYDELSAHPYRDDLVVNADFRDLASCVETTATRQRIDAGMHRAIAIPPRREIIRLDEERNGLDVARLILRSKGASRTAVSSYALDGARPLMQQYIDLIAACSA